MQEKTQMILLLGLSHNGSKERKGKEGRGIHE